MVSKTSNGSSENVVRFEYSHGSKKVTEIRSSGCLAMVHMELLTICYAYPVVRRLVGKKLQIKWKGVYN